ncbi:chaperonin 10-like protein [Leptodontidium sp. 2 PMI_412]|nr:chaperonin 10-like protein [Leptodontidium sp. 2 PMI_412]
MADSATMRAVRLYEYGGPGVLKVETHPIPSPSAIEVLIRVHAATITWWDLEYRKGHLKGIPGRDQVFSLPFQLGREAAGEVVAVGSEVKSFSVGDRVVQMTAPACGECEFCVKGFDNLCPTIEIPGHKAWGSYAQYILAPCLWSYSSVLHMVDARAKERPVIGLTGSLSKKQALLDAGADIVLNYRDEDIQQQIRKHTRGLGPDVVLDLVGGPMLTLGMHVAKLGARVVMGASMGGSKIELDIVFAFAKHLDLLGSRGATREEQARVMRLLAEGKINPIVWEKFSLEDVQIAHNKLEEQNHIGKILLLP